MSKFRILSLDGGGTWARIQASALQDIFGNTGGHEILGNFSFCAANSGGSIVLAALLADKAPGDIITMFDDPSIRNAIFSPLSALQKLGYELSEVVADGPRYAAAQKLVALRSNLAPAAGLSLPAARAAISNAAGRRPHFLITSFDFDRLRAIYFRSDVNSLTSNSAGGAETTVAEAAHGSSNAPVRYFDAPAAVARGGATLRCWDGALAGLNNPVMAALVEVLGNGYHRAPDGTAADIEVLSIGTGTVRLPLQSDSIPAALSTTPVASPSLRDYASALAGAIVDDPPDAANFQAHVALGGSLAPGAAPRLPIVRLSPSVQPILDSSGWRPPTIDPVAGKDTFTTLLNLQMDATAPDDVAAIAALTEAWMRGDVVNQPIRSGVLLDCQVGHRTYALGASDWRTRMAADPAAVSLP